MKFKRYIRLFSIAKSMSAIPVPNSRDMFDKSNDEVTSQNQESYYTVIKK